MFPPLAFNPPPLRRFPLEFYNGGRVQKTRMMPLLDSQNVWRYVRWFRQSSAVGQTDGQKYKTMPAICMHCMLTRNKNKFNKILIKLRNNKIE